MSRQLMCRCLAVCVVALQCATRLVLAADEDDHPTTTEESKPSPTNTKAAHYPTQRIMTTYHFIGVVLFACLMYYVSIFMCAKAVGENTSAMTAPARFAGTAAGATGGFIGRFISFLRSRGGRSVTYIPLAPSEETFGGSAPARRRAMEIGHGQTHEDDFFSASNEPAPTVASP